MVVRSCSANTVQLGPASRHSSGAAVVVPEQSAEAFVTLNRIGLTADFFSRVDQLVVESLMIAFGVIVRREFGQRTTLRWFVFESG